MGEERNEEKKKKGGFRGKPENHERKSKNWGLVFLTRLKKLKKWGGAKGFNYHSRRRYIYTILVEGKVWGF